MLSANIKEWRGMEEWRGENAETSGSHATRFQRSYPRPFFFASSIDEAAITTFTFRFDFSTVYIWDTTLRIVDTLPARTLSICSVRFCDQPLALLPEESELALLLYSRTDSKYTTPYSCKNIPVEIKS